MNGALSCQREAPHGKSWRNFFFMRTLARDGSRRGARRRQDGGQGVTIAQVDEVAMADVVSGNRDESEEKDKVEGMFRVLQREMRVMKELVAGVVFWRERRGSTRCKHGPKCTYGLSCTYMHTEEERQIFAWQDRLMRGGGGGCEARSPATVVWS